jgi:hypothetical protein
MVMPDMETLDIEKDKQDLCDRLGLIVLAEQMLPPLLTDGLYDATLDKYREAVERGLDE